MVRLHSVDGGKDLVMPIMSSKIRKRDCATVKIIQTTGGSIHRALPWILQTTLLLLIVSQVFGQAFGADRWPQVPTSPIVLDPDTLFVRGQDEEESVYDEPLETDRPDFTEASSVVGRGVLQIETGYTYFHDDEAGIEERVHSLPESLFRYGISDNIELRLVWNYLWTTTVTGGVSEHDDGAEDLVLGAKFALTTESGWIPESALIVDFSSPTGGEGFSGQHAEFGTNYLYGWELSPEQSLGGSFGYSTGTEFLIGPGPTVMEDRHNIFHSSVAYGLSLTDNLGAYIEYFGFYFDGLVGGRPENYLDGGLTYLLSNDVQLDVRAGVGLNQAADDYFTGVGYSVRY
jgi:hypothetical protein